MQTNHPLFDDLSKMASGAAGALMDVRREIEQQVAGQVKQWTQRLDVVSREEFDAVRLMAEKARAENEALSARLEALESKKAQ